MEIKIDGWKTGIRFSSAHFIPGLGKCARLHGHSYAIHARIIGETINGIIIDFELIKRNLKEIADELDHKILIPRGIEIIKEGKKIKFNFDGKEYLLPLEDCAILSIKSSSAENLANYVLQCLLKKMEFPKNVKKLEIGIDEGIGQGAWVMKEIK